MKRSEIEYRLRLEMSDIAPDMTEELLAACDAADAEPAVIDFAEAKKNKTNWKKLISAAAVLLIVFTAAVSGINAANQSCVLTVDVNPGIELTVNGLHRVKAADCINADASELYYGIDFEHMRLDDAISAITEKLCESGYISSDHNGMLISVDSLEGKPAEKLCSRIIDRVADTTAAAGCDYAILYQNLLTDETADSPKMVLVNKLLASYDEFSTEEMSGFSTQELIILSCRLDELPDNTRFFGKLQGYCNRENAESIAINAALLGEDCQRSTQLINYTEQLAYEVLMSDNKGKTVYVISAITGEILNSRRIEDASKPAESSRGSSQQSFTPPAPTEVETTTLSLQQILNILMNIGKISLPDLVDAMDDMSATTTFIDGKYMIVVTYELNGEWQTVFIDPSAAS